LMRSQKLKNRLFLAS